MTRLYLIRHGENDFLKSNRLPGQLPDIHLNAEGRIQSEIISRELSQQSIRAIYTSPLERAVETAEPLARKIGITPQIVEELQDTHVGKWQGKSIKQLSRLKYWHVIQNAPCRARFPGGEALFETQARVVLAIDQIFHSYRSGDRIAIFTHADPIKLAIAHFIGLPMDLFQRLKIDTGSISIINVSDQSVRLEGLNI